MDRGLATTGAAMPRLLAPSAPQKPSKAVSIGAQKPALIDGHQTSPTIFVVDDDPTVRETMRDLLSTEGFVVEIFASGQAFIDAYQAGREGCLLVDALMPGMSGIELIKRLKSAGHQIPAIMITGNGAVAMAVQAMQAGAVDFIEKPFSRRDLLASIARARDVNQSASISQESREAAVACIASLTRRQRQILDLVLAGHPSKNIAADLALSQRTVDNHRAAIMKKTGSASLPALIRAALAAA
jgi:two-component system, chemotaxis family, CheB/CheR fusion protein